MNHYLIFWYIKLSEENCIIENWLNNDILFVWKQKQIYRDSKFVISHISRSFIRRNGGRNVAQYWHYVSKACNSRLRLIMWEVDRNRAYLCENGTCIRSRDRIECIIIGAWLRERFMHPECGLVSLFFSIYCRYLIFCILLTLGVLISSGNNCLQR